MPDGHAWPPLSSLPITAEFPSPLCLGVLSCEVITTQVSCPLSSPGCQASSDITIPQTLLSLAFLLGLLWSLWAFLTCASAPPCGSVVGRSILPIVLCSSREMNFNTKKNECSWIPASSKKRMATGNGAILAPLPHPAIVSAHRH